MDSLRAHRVLNIAPGATSRDVQRAYRRAALACHPDRASAGEERAAMTRRFIEVRDAYEYLREHGTRAPSSDDILEEAGLSEPSTAAPAGRSFYDKHKTEDDEMSTAEKLGFKVPIDLEAIALWGVIIPGGALAAVLFVRWLFRTLAGPG